MRSFAHDVPTVYILRVKNDYNVDKSEKKKKIYQLHPNHMHILIP